MPLIDLLSAFLTGLCISLAMIPTIARLSEYIGGVDRPDARKIHRADTPRLGGIAIFFAFLLTFIVFCELDRRARGILAGAVVVFLTGLIDDLRGLPAVNKLFGTTVAAFMAVTVGDLRLPGLGDLLGGGEMRLGLFALPFTVLAVVGITNAMNLLDGLDGLAGGVAAITLLSLGMLAYKTGNQHTMTMSIALLGATAGFLRNNVHPAVIFMGDSGSLLLGYCMGVFSVQLVMESNSGISVVTPLMIQAVPVFDTLYVMYVRLKKGRSLFAPDMSHIHHRLMGLGFRQQSTVAIICGATAFLSAVALCCYRLPDYYPAAMLALILLLAIFAGKLIAARVEKQLT